MIIMSEELKAFGGGYVAGVTTTVTGATTYIHEVWGHAAANRLLHDYAPGEGPYWRVNTWQSFKDVFKGKFDSPAGWCGTGPGRPNALGQALGTDGRRSVIALAGSVPGYALNGVALHEAVRLRKTYPRLAAFLVGYVLVEHLMNSGYPIHAAFMSAGKLAINGRTGHDFAQFAVRMGRITGFKATTIARTVAISWVSALPLYGLYLWRQEEVKPLGYSAHFAGLCALAATPKLSPLALFTVGRSMYETYQDFQKEEMGKGALTCSALRTLSTLLLTGNMILAKNSTVFATTFIGSAILPPLLNTGKEILTWSKEPMESFTRA